jgi:glutathione S-transferase
LFEHFQWESRDGSGTNVPVLEDGDFVLWESNAIISYLATKHGSALVPTDARGRAEVDRWLSWQVAHLGPATRKVAFERIVKKVTGQGAPDQALIDAGTAEFAEFTEVLDGALDAKEYVANPRPASPQQILELFRSIW